MRNFIFHNPVKIYFGEGQVSHVAEEAKSRPGAACCWSTAAARSSATVPMTM